MLGILGSLGFFFFWRFVSGPYVNRIAALWSYMFFCYSMWTFGLDLILMFFSWHFQIPHLRPAEYKRSRLPRNRRTVNRPFGGVLSGTAVRERSANIAGYINKWSQDSHLTCNYLLLCRIIRAFLVEEQKIVKKVLKIQRTKDKTASK
jgi:hypothetical protein